MSLSQSYFFTSNVQNGAVNLIGITQLLEEVGHDSDVWNKTTSCKRKFEILPTLTSSTPGQSRHYRLVWMLDRLFLESHRKSRTTPTLDGRNCFSNLTWGAELEGSCPLKMLCAVSFQMCTVHQIIFHVVDHQGAGADVPPKERLPIMCGNDGPLLWLVCPGGPVRITHTRTDAHKILVLLS